MKVKKMVDGEEVIVEKEVEVKREIRFIDSYKFMASGLAALVKNLERESSPIWPNIAREKGLI